jgi:hypothetical protein
VEGSLTVALNNHSETWLFGGSSGTSINITGSNTQTDANNTIGLAGSEIFVLEQTMLGLLACGGLLILRRQGGRE